MHTDDFDYESALLDCQQGDRQALRRLYDQEARRLLGVALRIVRERRLAEDVVQDAFIQIWNRAGTFSAAQGSGRGWIYTIVRHRAISEIRRPANSRRVDVEDIETSEASKVAADAAPESSVDPQLLQRCLDALESERRACIEAAYLHGYTQAELASRFDKPLGTIKSWIRRGLLSLRECLQ